MTTAKPPSPSLAPPGLRPMDRGGTLERVEAKLDRIEARLAQLDPIFEAAPGLVAIAGDTFDEVSRDLGDLDTRVQRAMRLLERVTRPGMLGQLEQLVEIAEMAPAAISLAADSFDEIARSAAAQGLELEKVVPQLVKLVQTSLELLANEQIQHLLESDMLLPEMIEVLGQTAQAVACAQRAPAQSVGLFGAITAMREPELQRALGFALDIARRLGANIDSSSALALPAEHHKDPS